MKQKTKLLITAAVIALYAAIFFVTKAWDSQDVELQVSFLDVGQGDAIYIKAPNGKDILIDGGKTANTLKKKLSAVMTPGDKTIDIVLATHPDADHIGGLPMIIENFLVGAFIEPGVSSGSKTYATLMTGIGERNIERLVARTGMTIVLDEGKRVILRILAPAGVHEGQDTNDASIVGILSYGDNHFMLTGDAGLPTEQEILQLTEVVGLDVDVLKLGHHGSRTSSGEAFLLATQPEMAVVSAGCDNSYGHPHEDVVERVTRLGIETFSTCRSGTITYFSDGKNLRHRAEK